MKKLLHSLPIGVRFPPCRCADPADLHDPEQVAPSGTGEISRCRNPACGCLRYRPDHRKGR